MRERPILLNSEMVKAVLDGRKTQTRRVIKLDHERGMNNPVVRGKNGEASYVGCPLASTLCPFGQPGDRLWVREAFGFSIRRLGCGTPHQQIVYRASNPDAAKFYDCNGVPTPIKWTPSIHMPRRLSRITLEITSVRVERLNAITEEDARAEGCHGGHNSIPGYMYSATPHEHFHYIWTSIYGEEIWQSNQWVWVVEFRRIGGDV